MEQTVVDLFLWLYMYFFGIFLRNKAYPKNDRSHIHISFLRVCTHVAQCTFDLEYFMNNLTLNIPFDKYVRNCVYARLFQIVC